MCAICIRKVYCIYPNGKRKSTPLVDFSTFPRIFLATKVERQEEGEHTVRLWEKKPGKLKLIKKYARAETPAQQESFLLGCRGENGDDQENFFFLWLRNVFPVTAIGRPSKAKVLFLSIPQLTRQNAIPWTGTAAGPSTKKLLGSLPATLQKW